ncbi:uncharacterized protein N7473_002316 [Penicillium subrubescens]|uniref:uncharacterized protein n=1 Tax=Penicillium subrubescens TaxID=1316194 RepID=UPI002545A642|nr:uncharacterized protein N7473_002316 [Penicillium subrubescens]KAJ5905400.1 hypothetical protein N7473_002316 [Penicillium subrubescens]
MTSQLHRSNSLPFFPAISLPSLDLRTPLSFSNTPTSKRAVSPASSAGSHVSGVSHPPGSRKRRRSTILTDVSSDELLSSIDKWDDGSGPLESPSSKSGIRSHSYGSVITYNNPFMFDSTRTEYARPPPSYPTPTEPVSPILGSINRTPLSSTTRAEATGSYKCTHPGCTAAPFQTQYILNSHANIHSQDRPHFCPVDGCPRASGGKGFKRKNEMMRHGLVHNSPGYLCPFCPDQQHKYPRPDNLQRHVRVHHVDKSKDDPILREVLAQRPTRSTRGRRRRLYS